MLKQILRLLTLGDKLLAMLLICLSFCSLIVFKVLEEVGEIAFITVNGTETYQKRLSHDEKFVLHGAAGNSIIEIRGGKIRILDSDCPQKLCVHQGAIHTVGSLIVCVPNRITIWIKGKRQNLFDAITG